MKDQTLGSNLNLLFVGQVMALLVSVLGLFGISGGLWGMVNLASLIVVMIALSRLRSQHSDYGKAFVYEIILIVFALISGILLVVIAMLPVIEWLLWPVAILVTVGSNILNYLVVRYAVLPTANLVGDAGDLDTAALGALVNKTYLICAGVSVVCNVLGVIPLLGIVFNLLGKLVSLASIVGLGLMVYFLYRAKNCFN
ncbi:MAG: hypothetical protein K2F83_03470 [Oscillospiraceae bacterium]|nr:hypothetical protein [Oscillospiraceae bacterium]